MRPPFRRAWRWPRRLWEPGTLRSCFSPLIPGVIIAPVGRGWWLRRQFGLVFPGRWGAPVPPAGDPGACTATRPGARKRPAIFGGSGSGEGPLSPPHKVQRKLEFRVPFSATSNFIFCLRPTHFSVLLLNCFIYVPASLSLGSPRRSPPDAAPGCRPALQVHYPGVPGPD